MEDKEDNKEQEDEETAEKEDDATSQSGSQWGILPLMFEVSQKAMTPLREIYDWAVTEFFFYASFLVEENRKQINNMKKISARNH